MRSAEFSQMAAFVAIAERHSFAKAADHLGVSRSMLSQNLRALEDRLNVRLLNRTTRSVSLTQAGTRFLAKVRPALDELADATEEIRELQQSPGGLLRLVVQPPVAKFFIGPILARFLKEFPGIRLDVSVVKMPADFIAEGFDAGIRFGEQVERDMVIMRVMPQGQFLVVASPEYLAQHPRPRTPRDLRQHDCIRNRLPNGTFFGWQFTKSRRTINAAVDGRLIVDDIDLSIRAVLDGLGLAYLLYDYVADYIADGRLVPLLKDWCPRLSGFYLYHSSQRQVTTPLRALISFLRTESKIRGLSQVALPRSSFYPHYRLVGTSRR